MYVAWAAWGYRHLVKNGYLEGKTSKYGPWFLKLATFTEVIMAVGLIVLMGDTFWAAACGLRFLSSFPESTQQMTFVLARDGVGVIFFLMGAAELISEKAFDPLRGWWLWILNLAFLVLWFGLAPGPEWTDWTYALRHDYGWLQAWRAFSLSHILGRFITTTIYWRAWQR